MIKVIRIKTSELAKLVTQLRTETTCLKIEGDTFLGPETYELCHSADAADIQWSRCQVDVKELTTGEAIGPKHRVFLKDIRY